VAGARLFVMLQRLVVLRDRRRDLFVKRSHRLSSGSSSAYSGGSG
jgi:hypothetical protein